MNIYAISEQICDHRRRNGFFVLIRPAYGLSKAPYCASIQRLFGPAPQFFPFARRKPS